MASKLDGIPVGASGPARTAFTTGAGRLRLKARRETARGECRPALPAPGPLAGLAQTACPPAAPACGAPGRRAPLAGPLGFLKPGVRL
ncbi:MAG: hypothetical protein LBQ12_04200, partial [Deltaproteobacteria bacterium]|nr:hypothetical protein [Deltaproteobacteria bacterium]